MLREQGIVQSSDLVMHTAYGFGAGCAATRRGAANPGWGRRRVGHFHPPQESVQSVSVMPQIGTLVAREQDPLYRSKACRRCESIW